MQWASTSFDFPQVRKYSLKKIFSELKQSSIYWVTHAGFTCWQIPKECWRCGGSRQGESAQRQSWTRPGSNDQLDGSSVDAMMMVMMMTHNVCILYTNLLIYHPRQLQPLTATNVPLAPVCTGFNHIGDILAKSQPASQLPQSFRWFYYLCRNLDKYLKWNPAQSPHRFTMQCRESISLQQMEAVGD